MTNIDFERKKQMGSFIIDTINDKSFVVLFMPAPEIVHCDYHDDDILIVRFDNRREFNRNVGEVGFNSIENAIDFIVQLKQYDYNVKVYYNDFTQFMNYNEPTDNDFYVHSFDMSTQIPVLLDFNSNNNVYGPFIEEVLYKVIWKNNKPGFEFYIFDKKYFVGI